MTDQFLSDAPKKDGSMLGDSGYKREPLDFYPTPERATNAFLEIYEDDLESMVVWEPFCGNFAITNVIKDKCRAMLNTDIKRYEGGEPDLLVDFFSITTSTGKFLDDPSAFGKGSTLEEIAEACGKPVPDAIISNPPYGELTLKAIEHALKLMEPQKGFIALLLRKEFDSAKKHKHVFKDNPAFSAKIDLLHRPRWIADSKGAPRHNYSWYVFDFTKKLTAPGVKPELHYAG